MEFLLIVLVFSVVGVVLLVLRHRRPTSMRAQIDEFERTRGALAPPPDEHGRRRRGARRSG